MASRVLSAACANLFRQRDYITGMQRPQQNHDLATVIMSRQDTAQAL
jgi:hypothetical protein